MGKREGGTAWGACQGGTCLIGTSPHQQLQWEEAWMRQRQCWPVELSSLSPFAWPAEFRFPEVLEIK